MSGAGDTSDAGSTSRDGSGGMTGGDPTGTDAGTVQRSQEPPGAEGRVTPHGPGTGGRATRRTRVVLGEAATRRRPTDPARADLTEQTPVGEALVKGLVRAQLALALRLSLVVATSLGALPLLFAVAPGLARVKVVRVDLPWVLLGVLSFPFLLGVGWAYVRWAERNEQDFTAVIRRPE